MIPPDNVFFYDIGGEFFAEKVKMTTKVVRTVLRLPIQFQKIPPDRHKKSFLGSSPYNGVKSKNKKST